LSALGTFLAGKRKQANQTSKRAEYGFCKCLQRPGERPRCRSVSSASGRHRR